MERLAIVICAGSALGQNIIINGDFESNSAGSTQFNLSNVSFTSLMNNSTAFGTSEELDIITGLSLGIAPQSGSWKVGMHERQGLGVDAFSLELSQPVVAGQVYDFSCWVAGLADFANPLLQFEVGLSGLANDFGTTVVFGTAASTSAWNEVTSTFVAPVNASHNSMVPS